MIFHWFAVSFSGAPDTLASKPPLFCLSHLDGRPKAFPGLIPERLIEDTSAASYRKLTHRRVCVAHDVSGSVADDLSVLGGRQARGTPSWRVLRITAAEVG